MHTYSYIVLLPLLGAAIAGLLGRRIGDVAAMAVTTLGVLASAALSVMAFFEIFSNGQTLTVPIATWMNVGGFEVAWSLRFDQLTAVMLVVVTGVSAMVHIYSIGYMSHDPSRARFFSYLSLFTFAMLMLVTADNFVQLFFGWEGVGLASYLLIGFWHDRHSANAAAMKAFIVNRVGDFGLALGIMAIYFVFGSVSFDVVFGAAAGAADRTLNFLGFEIHALTLICLLLFIGAMGKSAQLPLHTWLPDAMEGPTPVSALIHAATMVTAGVFLVARASPLFEYAPDALMVVTVVGATTAFFAATVALTQNDIKRVIAYSTCSQLGYMFFALGVSAYPAAIFHLFTHAFFKALLFLGAGSVIHAVDGEQDMRRMGGLWRHIPQTYVMMWIGNLALAGVPFFAGFYSKDMVLEVAFAANSGVGMYAFIMGLAAAIMTAFYSWRLLFMTFHGKPRADKEIMDHVHESPFVMLLPLYVLAAGALFSGAVFYAEMVGHDWREFWGAAIQILPIHRAMEEAHNVATWVKLAPVGAGLLGILWAYYYYIRRPDLPVALARSQEPLYRFLLNKWYFDEIYDALFVRPAQALGRFLWKRGDGSVIDGLGPDGFARFSLWTARGASLLQSGYVYHYAFAMLIGVALFVTFFFVAGQ